MPLEPVSSRSPVTWWHGVLAFVVACVLQGLILVAIIIAQMLGLLGDDAEEIRNTLLSPAAIITQVLFTSGMLTALALGAPRLFGLASVAWLRITAVPTGIYPVVIIGVVSVGVLVDQVTFYLHLVAPTVFEAETLEMFSQLFAQATPLAFIAMTLTVVVGPGIGEELFFRGFLLRAFNVRWSAKTAIIVSAVLFGVVHFNFLQSTGAALIGLYLGYVAVRTGSIWPAIVAHGVNNLLTSLLSRFAQQELGNTWREGHPWWVLLIAAAVLVVSIKGLQSMTRAAHPADQGVAANE